MANIGVRTGASSNLLVLDVDPRHSGDSSLADLEAQYGHLPNTVESITGSRGRHVFYQYPGVEIASNVSRLGPGLDVRADQGYIVAPPSLHVSGLRYEWELSSHPGDTAVATMPEWLLGLLHRSPYTSHSIASRNISTSDGVGYEMGGFRGLEADLACAKALDLEINGLWSPQRGTKAFLCIIPGHNDCIPSASLFRTDSGDILYRDWHGPEAWFTLPEVRASLAYGADKKFKNQGPEHATWRLRLLYEADVVRPYDVPHRLLPPDTKASIRAVYEGFLLLLGLKWHYQRGSPTTFSWRFAAAWCEVSEWSARESMQWLLKFGYIQGVGTHRSQFGKETLVLLPVPPDGEHEVLSLSWHICPARGE